MKSLLFVAAASCAALGLAMTLAAFPVEAASNLNSSKSNIYRTIANDADQAACLAAGGKAITKDGKRVCEIAQTGNTGPDPQEGITITGCAPSASGDPLKGLNVSKGGTSSGGQLCP